MKDLLISFVIFFFTLFVATGLLMAIDASNKAVGNVFSGLILIYLYLFFSHLYEMIKEINLLYTLSRGSKPGSSAIRRIKGLASRKKQYQKLSDTYEHKFRDLFNSSAELLITEQNAKQEDFKKEIEKNKKEIKKKKNDKNNKIKELEDAKKELIKKVETSEKSKRKKIDILKKDISKEKNIYKELQNRHKLIDKWVKNR